MALQRTEEASETREGESKTAAMAGGRSNAQREAAMESREKGRAREMHAAAAAEVERKEEEAEDEDEPEAGVVLGIDDERSAPFRAKNSDSEKSSRANDGRNSRVDGSSKILGCVLCELCRAKPAKYRCPGCGTKTCCLPCVKAHKAKSGCNGQRCKTDYVALADFTDSHLISDYKFLEETLRQADVAKRLIAPLGGGDKYRLSRRMIQLRKEARRRSVDLLFVAHGMTKRKSNTSFFDAAQKCVMWRVEWKFAGTDVTLTTPEMNEQDSPLMALERLLENRSGNGGTRFQLRQYCALPISELRIFLRKEPCPANARKCYRLKMEEPLCNQLKHRCIIEFPQVTVALPSGECNFLVVEEEDPPRTLGSPAGRPSPSPSPSAVPSSSSLLQAAAPADVSANTKSRKKKKNRLRRLPPPGKAEAGGGIGGEGGGGGEKNAAAAVAMADAVEEGEIVRQEEVVQAGKLFREEEWEDGSDREIEVGNCCSLPKEEEARGAVSAVAEAEQRVAVPGYGEEKRRRLELAPGDLASLETEDRGDGASVVCPSKIEEVTREETDRNYPVGTECRSDGEEGSRGGETGRTLEEPGGGGGGGGGGGEDHTSVDVDGCCGTRSIIEEREDTGQREEGENEMEEERGERERQGEGERERRGGVTEEREEERRLEMGLDLGSLASKTQSRSGVMEEEEEEEEVARVALEEDDRAAPSTDSVSGMDDMGMAY